MQIAANPAQATPGHHPIAQRQGYQVWHLVGSPGCGKAKFASAAIEAITSLGQSAVWLESGEVADEFGGDLGQVAGNMTTPLVILLEANDWDLGEHPRYWQPGDRLIDLSQYAKSRHDHPGLDRLLALALLKQPTLDMDYLISQAKVQYADMQRKVLSLPGIATQRAGGAA